MNNNKTIGSNIKKLREHYKLSQETISSYLSIDQSLLCKIEKGERSLSLSNIEELCSLFGIKLDDLFDENMKVNGHNVAFRAKSIDMDDLKGIGMVNQIILNDKLLDDLLGEKENG